MKRTILPLSLLVLLVGAPAGAQTGGTSTLTNPSGSKPLIQAPVGHRQPRAADVPSEKNLSDPNSPANKEDAALDRKIRNICRGC
ncbi:MAG: hypothetical protein HY852_07605 [Bradyrhizobium sp.]|uniref:hypothetical protein n=1 Tax=Bradyrhizobium sp. TaxID=376 RepID=UPI0025C0BB18|nr:hypothetical protein [Bradyrhizobium sp.]MBI5261668.1 hypothetical protein [Bradyrhizobium sp.]